METNLLQIISACIVLVAALIPIHFMLGVKTRRQRILSSILLIVLSAYSAHSLIEALDLVGDNYQVFTKLCFIISAFGLMVSYSFFQLKTNHTLIGGIYGVAMMVAFSTWMIAEFVEVAIISNQESHEMVENVSSLMMAGFGIFLISRFFWLRNIIPIEAKYLRS